jgi:hypothetical protein
MENNNFNFKGLLSPDMQNSFKSIEQQAMQSGNPQQYLMQKYANNSQFMDGINILNKEGIQGFYNYLARMINR